MRRNSHGVHQGRLEVTLVALGLPPFLSHWFFLTKYHCEPGESFPDLAQRQRAFLCVLRPERAVTLICLTPFLPFGPPLKESAHSGSR